MQEFMLCNILNEMKTIEKEDNEINALFIFISMTMNDYESARLAFSNGNYKKASEIYSQAIKESGINVDLLLGLADSLAYSGKLQEALNAYIRAYSCDSSKPERLDRFIDTLSNIARTQYAKNAENVSDLYSCVLCYGIMIDPVTLSCGHSFSKHCIPSNTQSWNCKKCGKNYSREYLSELKTSVAISSLLEKWWAKEIEAIKLCYAGHENYRQGNISAAIENFSMSLELDPTNHISTCGRSCAFLSTGQPLAALNDAKQTVSLCPVWSEGYFQKGATLVKLEQYEDAIIAYLQCVVFDSQAESAKSEIKKILHNLLSDNQSHFNENCDKTSDLQNDVFEEQRQHAGSDGSLYSGDSSDSNWATGMNESDSSSEDEGLKLWDAVERNYEIHEQSKLHNIVDAFFHEMKRRDSIKTDVNRNIDPSLVKREDFECPLCMRLLWEPVTTPCGHTFCRTCLDRCFDHQPNCPLCKSLLSSFLAERVQCTTEFIDVALKSLLPQDYNDRKKIYEEEMEELANAGKDPEHVIPLFICTIAYPTVPCPLHVFEPRYRLMIRQCMESGTRQFGMCAYIDDQEDSIANYGTMLEIRDVQYFPDGRSVVDTIGSKRFRILKKGMRDGYHTGAVEFLCDEEIDSAFIEETRDLHNRVRKVAESWFSHLPNVTKRRILQHFGPMPEIEAEYLNNPNGPSWFWWVLAILPLDPRAQIRILGMISLPRRLQSLHRVLQHLHSANIK